MSSSDIAWPQTSTPRIKQRIASYHTTKVVAHKVSYSKLRLKIGCHGRYRWTPILHIIPCAHLSPKPKQHLDRFSYFCTDDRRASLYNTRALPLKIAPSNGGIWTPPPSNTWFPWPTWVLNPNGISIGAAVFAGLTSVTDRQTDRPTDRPTDHVTGSVTKAASTYCDAA